MAMGNLYSSLGLLLGPVFLLSATLPCSAQVKVGTTTQISLNTAGGVSNGGSSTPAIGANGRHLVFASSSSDLVGNDGNSLNDIFERNLKTSAVAIVSINSNGQQADGVSSSPAVSQVTTDGFYAIAFVSTATNLGSLTTSGQISNIYVRMPTLGITEIVSTAPGFALANGNSSAPSITVTSQANGKRIVTIVFESQASNLIAGDDNQLSDVYAATFTAPTSKPYSANSLVSISRVSSAAEPGSEPDGASTRAKVSTDGRYVVYDSSATNLVVPTTPSGGVSQVYRTDLKTGQTILISQSPTGEPGDLNSFAPSVNFNGRFVSYISDANNIIENALPDLRSAFLFDALTFETDRINESADGLQGDGQPSSAIISQNGRFVGLSDTSTNFVDSDTNGVADSFIKDMDGGEIARVSVGPTGLEGDALSTQAAIAATSLNAQGLVCVFTSRAANLTAAPTAGQGTNNVFINLTTSPPPGLTKDTKLDVPPDVTVSAKKIKLFAQKFAVAQPTNTLLLGASNMQVRYDFQITRTTKSCLLYTSPSPRD